MQFEKSSPEFVQFFTQAVPNSPEIVHKKMFGYPACFIHGNMFTGLHGSKMFVRLSEEKRNTLLEQPGTHIFEPMPGRPMKEYVVLSQPILDDKEELQHWLNESIAYVQTLPPKVKK